MLYRGHWSLVHGLIAAPWVWALLVLSKIQWILGSETYLSPTKKWVAMENETPVQLCRNCEYPLPEGARFCPQCGQKNHDGRLTFKELVTETVATVLNIDNQAISTVKNLALPGKLTVDYFKGKHIRYYRPIRLFFFSGALLIAILSLQISNTNNQIMPKSLQEIRTLHQQHLFYLKLDSLKKETALSLKNPRAIAALDTLLSKLDSSYINSENDSIELTRKFYRNSKKDTLYHEGQFNISLEEGNQINIAVDDIENMKEDSLLRSYHIVGFWEKLLVRQQIRLLKKGDNFVFYILSNTLWMMLVMMPMLAVVLKLMYIRSRNFYYFEHLIFSFHVHSFQFLLFALVVLSGYWLSEATLNKVTGFAFLGAFLYAFFALKRFYQQGWLKTILKYLIISFLYLFILFGAMVGLTLVSFALF